MVLPNEGTVELPACVLCGLDKGSRFNALLKIFVPFWIIAKSSMGSSIRCHRQSTGKSEHGLLVFLMQAVHHID